MNEADVLEFARASVVVFLKVSLPILLTALGIGLVISVFQTLTQIQETTLTFVPKIVTVFLALIFFLTFMLHTLSALMTLVFDHIAALG